MLVTLWDYRVKNDMRTSDLELSTKGLAVILFIPNKIISFIKWCEWSKYPSQQKSTLVTLLSQIPCQGRELNF